MIKVWPLPVKISEDIKILDASFKKLEKYSISDIDMNFSSEHSFPLSIDSFLNISKKTEITNEINTTECTQYNFPKQFKGETILSKNIFLIRAIEELFLSDSTQKIKTLVKTDIDKNGITSLFPIFYTLSSVNNIDKLLPQDGIFKSKLLEYKNKINNIFNSNPRIEEFEEYFDNLKFDSDNFIGDNFMTIFKSDNNDFIKSKISVKIGENDYFVISNLVYGKPIKEKMDFTKPTFLSTLFLSDKLKKSVDCFIDTFCNDFLIDSL